MLALRRRAAVCASLLPPRLASTAEGTAGQVLLALGAPDLEDLWRFLPAPWTSQGPSGRLKSHSLFEVLQPILSVYTQPLSLPRRLSPLGSRFWCRRSPERSAGNQAAASLRITLDSGSWRPGHLMLSLPVGYNKWVVLLHWTFQELEVVVSLQPSILGCKLGFLQHHETLNTAPHRRTSRAGGSNS